MQTTDTQTKDPMQEAADSAGGFEGPHLRHNCKDGAVYLGDVAVGPDFTAVFLMETAAHGWLKFDEKNLVDRDIRRYADVAPNRSERRPDWEPNTSVLAVSETGLLTYAGASWSARGAFEAELLKPYVRLRKQAFPVVNLRFKPHRDKYGNYKPTFTVTAWKPRSDFAGFLGEETPAPQLTAPPTAPEMPPRRPALVTSGRAQSSPSAEPFAGVDPNDEIPW